MKKFSNLLFLKKIHFLLSIKKNSTYFKYSNILKYNLLIFWPKYFIYKKLTKANYNIYNKH